MFSECLVYAACAGCSTRSHDSELTAHIEGEVRHDAFCVSVRCHVFFAICLAVQGDFNFKSCFFHIRVFFSKQPEYGVHWRSTDVGFDAAVGDRVYPRAAITVHESGRVVQLASYARPVVPPRELGGMWCGVVRVCVYACVCVCVCVCVLSGEALSKGRATSATRHTPIGSNDGA